MHTTYAVVNLKSEKQNSGLNGIQTHDLCNTGAVLYQLSYHANGELDGFIVIRYFFYYAYKCKYSTEIHKESITFKVNTFKIFLNNYCL